MKYFIFIITLLLGLNAKGQEVKLEDSKGFHKIALVVGITHIPAAIEDGEKTSEEFIPTLGVDYFYHFKKGWRLGLVMDYEFANYIVKFDKEDLTREGALVTGILVGYEFAEKWAILLGPGIEFERNKNIGILRSSLEYELELSEFWGLFPSANYDFKQEYSTWSVNIGISRRF